MIEKTQPAITLQGIEADAISLLIDYAYTGRLVITEENVQVSFEHDSNRWSLTKVSHKRYPLQILLPAASLLQIVDIQSACCQFLIRQLHATNCLGIRKFADTHSCPSLLQSAQSFALKNFSTVTETEEFLNLSANEVRMARLIDISLIVMKWFHPVKKVRVMGHESWWCSLSCW